MRIPLSIVALASVLSLGGCADMPGFGQGAGVQAPANPDHPRAEALLARESSAAPTRGQLREQMRDPVREPVRDAAVTLREGIRLYNNGDFNGAIARLNGPEIQAASRATRASALKYIAFSYCVTQRPVPCRQAFDKALRIDPDFTLAPGEEGHPMWGPVFEKARANR